MKNKTVAKPGKRYLLKYRGVKCLNCDHPLDVSDKYCPNCSQANSTKKITFKDFIDEFFGSLVSYDTKIARTLSAMLFKPGKITRDFIDGKRVTYTNPFRFFLSISIIYFLLFNITESDSIETFDNTTVHIDEIYKDSLQIEGISADEQSQINKILQKSKSSISKLERKILDDPSKYYDSIAHVNDANQLGNKINFYRTIINKKSPINFKKVNKRYNIPDNFWNRFMFNSTQSAIKAYKKPSEFIKLYISRLPFIIFFFLPIFALFIWVFYSKKKYYYLDHLVFSFHVQTMLILLMILSSLLSYFFGWSLGWLFILIFTFYLYKAMRNFYKQSRFLTLVKFMVLNTIFFNLATITSIFIILISIAIF